MTVAIYPGRYDPVTLGHLDIMIRASELFDKVIVAVFATPDRKPMFNTEERMGLIREAAKDTPTIEVISFTGLVVDCARIYGATVMIRGLRMSVDFEYEFEMALMNRRLAPDIDVACLMTDVRYQFVRSSLLKEVARYGGDISGLAPPNVINAMGDRLPTVTSTGDTN
jgi:pantetheine-phosphate adenylyltransferase